jgi:hypothetical protein
MNPRASRCRRWSSTGDRWGQQHVIGSCLCNVFVVQFSYLIWQIEVFSQREMCRLHRFKGKERLSRCFRLKDHVRKSGEM